MLLEISSDELKFIYSRFFSNEYFKLPTLDRGFVHTKKLLLPKYIINKAASQLNFIQNYELKAELQRKNDEIKALKEKLKPSLKSK